MVVSCGPCVIGVECWYIGLIGIAQKYWSKGLKIKGWFTLYKDNGDSWNIVL